MAYSVMVWLVNPSEHPQEEDEMAPRRVPFGCFGRPEDVAELAMLLLPAAVGWLPDQVIVLNGGISCHFL
jgi:NAD(P)-dependent dehydrogenase (short-subunit alcohol dehydrogenase family)